jgi:hypothetical protein
MTGVWIFFGIYLAFGCAAGVFVLGLCRAAARGDEQAERQYAEAEDWSGPAQDCERSLWQMAYNPADGQTVPRATSTGGQWPRVLRPATAPDQPSDSGRRGDH